MDNFDNMFRTELSDNPDSWERWRDEKGWEMSGITSKQVAELVSLYIARSLKYAQWMEAATLKYVSWAVRNEQDRLRTREMIKGIEYDYYYDYYDTVKMIEALDINKGGPQLSDTVIDNSPHPVCIISN